jgi:hypothetical protein
MPEPSAAVGGLLGSSALGSTPLDPPSLGSPRSLKGGAVVPVSAGSLPPEPQAHEQAAIAIALPHIPNFRSIVRTAIGESASNVNTCRDLSHRITSQEEKLSATRMGQRAPRTHLRRTTTFRNIAERCRSIFAAFTTRRARLELAAARQHQAMLERRRDHCTKKMSRPRSVLARPTSFSCTATLQRVGRGRGPGSSP